MSRRYMSCIALLAVTATRGFGQLSEEQRRQFEKAGREIVRLSPSAFSELPGNLVEALKIRGCTIPQDAFSKKPVNVIHGAFARPGQTDWAVLCSINGVSSILVFWNGSEKDPASIASAEDRNFLQGITDHRIGYSREISPVGKAFINEHYQAYGGPKPPKIEHQGIDDAFVEKASVVFYYYGGKWLQLTGSD
jgi:hypothetical protein